MRLDVRLQHQAGDFRLDVSFRAEVPCFALVGPSGVGKSLVLSCLAGLVRPSAGRIQLGDRVLFDSAQRIDMPSYQRRTGMVLQQATLFPLHTVRGNLLYGRPADRSGLSFEQVVELLEISHLLDRRSRNLSGGERQRVALGRAILSEPDILLADEPLSALDGARRERLLGLFLKIRDELKVPILLVTHNEEVVRALAQDVYQMPMSESD